MKKEGLFVEALLYINILRIDDDGASFVVVFIGRTNALLFFASGVCVTHNHLKQVHSICKKHF